MSVYNNRFKNHYRVDNEGYTLIIGKNDCYKISPEVAYLIDILPKTGTAYDIAEHLELVGVKDMEGVISQLFRIGVLEYEEGWSFKSLYRRMKRSIFNPKWIIFGCKIQEKVGQSIVRKVQDKIEPSQLLKFSMGFTGMLTLWGLLDVELWHTSPLSTVNGMLVITLFVLGICVHELGHSAMCAYTNMGFRPVGITVFIFYPVMFTNVSGITELGLIQRSLINCAGVFTQSLYMSGLVIAWLLTGSGTVATVLKLLYTMLFFNLHPFIKTDGYWFFHDVMHFYDENKSAIVIKAVYYVLYSLFAVYLINKAVTIFGETLTFFSNWTLIRLNLELFFNIFNIYITILIMKASINRFKEGVGFLIKTVGLQK